MRIAKIGLEKYLKILGRECRLHKENYLFSLIYYLYNIILQMQVLFIFQCNNTCTYLILYDDKVFNKYALNTYIYYPYNLIIIYLYYFCEWLVFIMLIIDKFNRIKVEQFQIVDLPGCCSEPFN